MPYPEALATAAGRWLPNLASMDSRLTNAWTAPESPNPRINGHRVSQNMKNPSRRLRPMASSHPVPATETTSTVTPIAGPHLGRCSS